MKSKSKQHPLALKRTSLDLLACPGCHGDLISQNPDSTGDLTSGELICSQ